MTGIQWATIDPVTFRTTLGQFCTGVTIISANAGDEVRAMTATAFSSVSMDPPMVLICIGKQTRIEPAIRTAGRFGVSILSDRQEQISRQFGRPSAGLGDFTFESWEKLPVVGDALAHIAADVEDIIPGGDHTVFLGKVTATRVAPGEPLVHFGGNYRELADRPHRDRPSQTRVDGKRANFAVTGHRLRSEG